MTGAMTDHLTPWKGCYRTTELLGGESTFVLSNAGHIASLVNPPGNPKASYFVGGDSGHRRRTPGTSRRPRRTGWWWEFWADWSIERSGDEVTAPAGAGNETFRPLQPAPGPYVRDKAPA